MPRSNPLRQVLMALSASSALVLAISGGTAFAHVRPQTTVPSAGQRLGDPPAHIVLNYDGTVVPSGTSVTLLDASGSQLPLTADAASTSRMSSLTPMADLGPGPYTVDWTTVDAQDGHQAQGFYTFVVAGGPVGIITGTAQSKAQAADLQETLTVSAAADGASMLRVDLSNSTGVERVRIRLSRPDLGEDLLDTQPSGDGGWVLANDEVALPGAWHAEAIVRRTNIFDDASAAFDFTVDAASGQPNFATAQAAAAAE